MPACPQTTQPTVLIVDPSADTREVLRTVLTRRGMRIFVAEAADDGLKLAHQHRPDVVVIDSDAPSADSAVTHEHFADDSRRGDENVILLGRIRRSTLPAGRYVFSKPYHFAHLVNTIERLVAKAA